MKTRDLKFRSIIRHKENNTTYKIDWDVRNPSAESFETLRDYEEIIASYLQYTDLKDCNDKDIFIGDILEMHQTINGQSKFVIVDCIGGYDVRYLYDINRKYEYSIMSLLGIEEMEIIGNIYENAGLLAAAP